MGGTPNSLMYLNLINEITPNKRFSLSQKYIGAKEIDSQTITAKQPFKGGPSLLLVLNTQEWKDAALLIGYQLELGEYGKIEITSNFSNRTIIDLKLKKSFLVIKEHGLFLDPLLVYNLIDDKIFWQAKIRLKLDLQRKRRKGSGL